MGMAAMPACPSHSSTRPISATGLTPWKHTPSLSKVRSGRNRHGAVDGTDWSRSGRSSHRRQPRRSQPRNWPGRPAGSRPAPGSREHPHLSGPEPSGAPSANAIRSTRKRSWTLGPAVTISWVSPHDGAAAGEYVRMVVGMGSNRILRDASEAGSADMFERRRDPARFPAVVGPAFHAASRRDGSRCDRVAVDRRGKHDAKSN